MNELFGISMNTIMVALLIALAVVAATVGWVVLRNRVMFLIGIRNIPRRRAQTVLIVIGLMLSTLIVSAAFSIGDTVNYSITNQAYGQLHSIDEVVQAQTDEGEGQFDAATLNTAVPIPQTQADRFVQEFRTSPRVDGAVGVLQTTVPVSNAEAGQTEPSVNLVAPNPAQMDGFPDIESRDGRQLSLAELGPDELYADESAADALDLRPGGPLTLFVRREPHEFTVKDIVKDRVLTGALVSDNKGLAMGLPAAQQLLERPDQVDFIAVSNKGDVRGGLAASRAVTDELNGKLAGTQWRADDTKASLVKTAADAASGLTAFFVVLGLFSIASGLLLIFLIFVMLAAERKMEMGMTRAVGTKRTHLIQIFMSEGMAYNVMSAAVGCALGVAVSLVMVGIMARLFAAFDLSIVFHVTPRSLIVSYCLGIVLTFVTVTFSSWRISNLNIVSAIRDVPDAVTRRAGFWSLFFGIACTLLGPLLVLLGLSARKAFPYTFGVTLLALGITLLARRLGAAARPAFTAMGVFLLVFWILGAGNDIPFTGDLDGGIEMFFLSGIAMVAAATFVLIYNADLMLRLLTYSGNSFSSLIPSIRMAVAHPLANKFRTGMTIAMIALVVFALVMMSTMNSNFSRLFLGKEALGGYDVQVQENSNNPIKNLPAELQQNGFDASQIERADRIDVANQRIAQVRMAPRPDGTSDEFGRYFILGLSSGFIANNAITFQARATGLDSDAAVWKSLADHPDQAVIDAFAIPSNGGFSIGGPTFSLEGVKDTDKTFEPITIQVRNAATGTTREVQIVGIISTKASATYFGLYLAPETFTEVYGVPDSTVDFVRLAPGVNANTAAKQIEKSLLFEGVQADSLRKIIDDAQRLNQGFIYLIQGFMGLGLFVGIAAVGVIAFRTVVERRQQIGMLRAIGYTRGAVALSFLMESSFIALLGIVTGIVLALILAFQLITSGGLAQGVHGVYVPWLQVIGIAAFAFIASLLMTFIPSRQASSIPIAEALRYE
jgi:putative ABC transport system permease protein